jgi:twinkle protein
MMLTETAMTWLQGRSLDPAKAEAFGVQSVRRGTGEWLAFPYVRAEKTITTKYRRIDEKAFSQDAGAPEKLVWNEDSLTDSELTGPVILTEGELDALSAIEAGYERVVSVPDGAPNKPVDEDATESDKWSYLDHLIKLLRNEREIIIAADGDQNGANLLAHLAARLGKARCKYLRYPAKSKDLNDVLMRGGPSLVQRVITAARHVHMEGIVKLSDLPRPPEMKVYRAGLSEDFNKAVGFVRGHLSVWTGIPNHGKSALVRACCIELSQSYGWRFCVASFEDDIRMDYARAVARYQWKAADEELTERQLAQTDAWINERFSFVIEDEKNFEPMTVNWVVQMLEAGVVRYGADMVVIDPWSKLDHSRPPGVSENDYTGQVLNLLKRFARRYNVHVALVAHPKKIEPKADGSYRPPGGYDISGSSHFYNMPDLGVTAFRDRERGEGCCRVIPWKIKRQPQMGVQKSAFLQFHQATARYSDWHDQ